MTRDELEQLLDEYATLHRRYSWRGPTGTHINRGPTREQRERAQQIRQQILDAVAPSPT